MSGKSRYDKFIPLFGRDNDLRVRLWLHELQNVAEDKMKKAGRAYYKLEDIKFDSHTPAMEARFFAQRGTEANEDVHPEWKNFFSDLVFRLTRNAPTIAQVETKALEMIKHPVTIVPGSLNDFMSLVIQKVFTINGSSGNITNRTNEWVNAQSVSVKPLSISPTVNVLNNDLKPTDIISWCMSPCTSETTPLKTYFNYNLDRFLRSQLEEAVNQPLPVGDDGVSTLLQDTVEAPAGPVYLRNTEGNLVEVVNGNVVREVHSGSQAFEQLTVANKCLGTGVESADG